MSLNTSAGSRLVPAKVSLEYSFGQSPPRISMSFIFHKSQVFLGFKFPSVLVDRNATAVETNCWTQLRLAKARNGARFSVSVKMAHR